MSNKLTNNLTSGRMQQLLAAVGSTPKEDTTQIEFTEYDWHQPHYFSNEQLGKLDDFARKVASAVAEKFASLCQSSFDVTITSVTQHYAAEFLNQSLDGKQSDYYLTFSSGKGNPCGVISIPLQTAVVWTIQLLGDSESKEDTAKELSQLELSILSDIAAGIVEVFSGSFDTFDFHPAEGITKGQWPLLVQDTAELNRITFSVKEAESEKESVAHISILCSELQPLVGKTEAGSGKHVGLSKEDVSKTIIEHIQQIQVGITAQLATTCLTFDQVLGLRPNDILVLDKKVSEPIDLIIDGKTVRHGQPAKSAGQYAVVITESR